MITVNLKNRGHKILEVKQWLKSQGVSEEQYWARVRVDNNLHILMDDDLEVHKTAMLLKWQ